MGPSTVDGIIVDMGCAGAKVSGRTRKSLTADAFVPFLTSTLSSWDFSSLATFSAVIREDPTDSVLEYLRSARENAAEHVSSDYDA